MKCVICKNGDTRRGSATVTLARGGATVVIRDVPAEVCENCGEYYLSEQVTGEVMALAQQAVAHRAEIEVLHYSATSASSG